MHWSYIFLALSHQYWLCRINNSGNNEEAFQLHQQIFKTEGWFNIKMSSYQYRESGYGDKTVIRSSYLHNGNYYAGKMTSLYWIRAQVCIIRCSLYPIIDSMYLKPRTLSVCSGGHSQCMQPLGWVEYDWLWHYFRLSNVNQILDISNELNYYMLLVKHLN